MENLSLTCPIYMLAPCGKKDRRGGSSYLYASTNIYLDIRLSIIPIFLQNRCSLQHFVSFYKIIIRTIYFNTYTMNVQ